MDTFVRYILNSTIKDKLYYGHYYKEFKEGLAENARTTIKKKKNGTGRNKGMHPLVMIYQTPDRAAKHCDSTKP